MRRALWVQNGLFLARSSRRLSSPALVGLLAAPRSSSSANVERDPRLTYETLEGRSTSWPSTSESERQEPKPTPTTTRPSALRWPLLLLAILSLLLASCCESPPLVTPPEPSPPLPVRPEPRASDEILDQWLQARPTRIDLLVLELMRERAWSDALVRDGRWGR